MVCTPYNLSLLYCFFNAAKGKPGSFEPGLSFSTAIIPFFTNAPLRVSTSSDNLSICSCCFLINILFSFSNFSREIYIVDLPNISSFKSSWPVKS